MDCTNNARNAARCTCTYGGCPRHGVCCECVSYLRTYDRSVSYFVSCRR